MTNFHNKTPTLDNQWRAIILFGRNVASYKFALAKSLLDLADQEKTNLGLADIAPKFSQNICDHLKQEDKQSTSKSSKFLDSCRNYNSEKISQEKLVLDTVKNGFNNVIDAFHIVNQDEVGVRFFEDNRKSRGGITLTDNIFKLKETIQGFSMKNEVEARWRLVETAWSLNIGRNLVGVQADFDSGTLFVDAVRRVNITSARDALNGYQKGLCFYCFDEISVFKDHPALADVDHFFPWILKSEGVMSDLDGVWNLVLACRDCNRGESGKFARVPSISLVDRLHSRNSYLIDSHHPLRETLIQQTGSSLEDRRRFLQTRFDEARATLIHTWEPNHKAPSIF